MSDSEPVLSALPAASADMALLAVLSAANRASSVDELATAALPALEAVLPFELAFLLLTDPAASRPRLVHSVHVPPELVALLENLPPPGPSLDGTQDGPEVAAALSPLMDAVRQTLLNHEHYSSILVPLVDGGCAIGVLALVPKKNKKPAVDEIMSQEGLEMIGKELGIALNRIRAGEQLKASEAQYRTFIERSRDGFWELDAQGRVTLANQAALDLTGYSREEVERWSLFTPSDESAPERAARWQRLSEQGYLQNERVRIRTKSGETRIFNQTAWSLYDENGQLARVQMVMRDVTARVRIEEELERRTEEARVLNQIATELSHPYQVQESLDKVCDQIVSLTGMDAVAIFLLDEAHHGVTLMAYRNIDLSIAEHFRQIQWRPEIFEPDFPPERAPGLFEYLILSQETMVFQDLSIPSRWDLAPFLQAGFRSGIAAPLRYGSRLYGIIAVGSSSSRSFDAHDSDLIANIGLRLALTIRNKQLFDGMQRQVSELEALARVGEWLSHGTGSPESLKQVVDLVARTIHADRVSIYLREEDNLRLAASSGPVPIDSFALLDYHRRILDNEKTLVVSHVDTPEVDDEQRRRLLELRVGAYIGVPLVTTSGSLGVLFINQISARDWTEEEQRLAATFAQQIASSLYNVNLLRETQARVRELEGLAEMSTFAASLIDEDVVTELALDAIHEMLGVPLVAMTLLRGDQFLPPQIHGMDKGKLERLEMTPGLRRLIDARQTVVLDSLHPLALTPQGAARLQAHHVRALVSIPLYTATGPLGLLTVARRDDHIWSRAEVRMVRTMGNQLATAIANARLYREQLDRAHRLSLLAELSQACSATLQLQTLLDTAASQARVVLDASQVSLRLVEGEYLVEGALAGFEHPERRPRRLRINPGLRRMLDEARAVAICDLAHHAALSPEFVERMGGEGAAALLAIPLAARGQCVGLISVYRPEPHEWSPAEIDFAATIANTIAITISNAHLFETLQQEQRDIEMTLNSVFSGVLTTDEDGFIQTWNRAAAEMTGFPAESMRGKNWADEVARVGDDRPDELIFEAMAEGEIVFGLAPRRLTTAEGKDIPLSEAAAPLRDAEGRIRGAVGAFWDRTKEHQAERARLDFLHEVSHELRNSLTAVLPMAEMLREPGVKKATRERAIQVIAGQVERLKDFSRRFLAFETDQLAQPVQKESLDIVTFIQGLLTAMCVKYPEHHFELVGQAGPVYADRRRLETVMLNLLDNAAKYSPPGSPVTLELKTFPKEVRVAIRNEGPLIPEDVLGHVFERGYRAQTPGIQQPIEGFGIGLWLVQTKLREMGSVACVDNGRERGVTFYFTLEPARMDYEDQGKNSRRGRRQVGSRSAERST